MNTTLEAHEAAIEEDHGSHPSEHVGDGDETPDLQRFAALLAQSYRAMPLFA